LTVISVAFIACAQGRFPEPVSHVSNGVAAGRDTVSA